MQRNISGRQKYFQFEGRPYLSLILLLVGLNYLPNNLHSLPMPAALYKKISYLHYNYWTGLCRKRIAERQSLSPFQFSSRLMEVTKVTSDIVVASSEISHLYKDAWHILERARAEQFHNLDYSPYVH